MSDYRPTDQTARRTRLEPPETADVAVIGCGLGGLSAAAYLARAGLSVVCFDGHYVAGGCGTQFHRKGEGGHYNFDVGLHYLGQPDGSIRRILRGAGVEVDPLPLDPDGFDTLIFPELTFKVPAGRDRYRDRLVETFPRERRGIDRYMAFLAQMARVGAANERSYGRTDLRMAGALVRAPRVIRYQNRTIGSVLDGLVRDPLLKAVLLGQNGDYALPPSEVSALLHAGLVNHYLDGAWYPRGGGQVFADGLAREIEAAGGAICLRMPVARVIIEDGRAVGVQTRERRGQTYTVRARTVLSNADLRQTLLELVGPEHLPARAVERAQEWVWPEAIFMTCLGVRGDLRDHGMRPANYWAFDGVDFDALYARGRKELTPWAAYITSASLKDPDTTHHAPPGISTVEVMSIVSGEPRLWGAEPDAVRPWRYKRSNAYQRIKARMEADMIARLEAVFPGMTAGIVLAESATPLTHTRFTGASEGTSYGIAAIPAQFLQKRPGVRGPIPELYHCGASMRAGHGVAGTLTSGYLAARKIAALHGRAVPDLR